MLSSKHLRGSFGFKGNTHVLNLTHKFQCLAEQEPTPLCTCVYVHAHNSKYLRVNIFGKVHKIQNSFLKPVMTQYGIMEFQIRFFLVLVCLNLGIFKIPHMNFEEAK